MSWKRAMIFTALLAAGTVTASAKDDDEKARARLGQVMYSAFRCAAFAIGNAQEENRLFAIGLDAGRRFIEAVENGQISSSVMGSEVPTGVVLYVRRGVGAHPEFIMGRIFEGMLVDLFDRYGEIFNSTDEGVRKSKAHVKYVQENCALIR